MRNILVQLLNDLKNLKLIKQIQTVQEPEVIIPDSRLKSQIYEWLKDDSIVNADIYPGTSNGRYFTPSKVEFPEPHIKSVPEEFAKVLALTGLNPDETYTLGYLKGSPNYLLSLRCSLKNAQEDIIITLEYGDGWDFCSYICIEYNVEERRYHYDRNYYGPKKSLSNISVKLSSINQVSPKGQGRVRIYKYNPF